jgi:hypothetical protein
VKLRFQGLLKVTHCEAKKIWNDSEHLRWCCLQQGEQGLELWSIKWCCWIPPKRPHHTQLTAAQSFCLSSLPITVRETWFHNNVYGLRITVRETWFHNNVYGLSLINHYSSQDMICMSCLYNFTYPRAETKPIHTPLVRQKPTKKVVPFPTVFY